MKPKKGGNAASRFPDLRPEFVPLGFLAEEPTHGYALYGRFGESLAGLWRISESQMYATLKRLEERGLIEGAEPVKGAAASRRVLSPTAAGRAFFGAWLLEPSACSPRVLRLEFLTRLFFARRIEPVSLGLIYSAQRSAVANALERSIANRLAPSSGFDVFGLALEFSESQLRSALEWLDDSVGPAILT